MTTKLTLTMGDKVIAIAKKYASQYGKSLSDVVENYLKSIAMVDQPKGELSPTVSALLGSIKLPDDFDYKKEIGSILTRKYSYRRFTVLLWMD